MKILKRLGCCIFVMAMVSPVWANGWCPIKDKLSNNGFTVNLSETADYVSVLHGGLLDKDTFVGLLRLELSFNTEKLGWYKGGEFYVQATHVQEGLKPTGELVGDLQAVNNNEAPRTTRLFQAWYQQHLWNERIAFLIGIHDLNADFMISDYSCLYINGAFGALTTLTANVPASVYPLAAPAARVKITPVENLEILAGVYDGDPGDSDINEHSTNISLKSQDGLLSIAEVGWHYKIPGDLLGSIKAGGWHHSGNFTDVSAVDENGDAVPYDDNYSGYVILDQLIYREKDDQGLGVFFMGSGSPRNRNTVDRQIYAGLNYTGLLPTRDADVLGVAFTNSSLSNKRRASNDLKRGETTIEGTYQIKVNDHIAVQPDMQYVLHPNGDPTIKNASVFTLRTQITF